MELIKSQPELVANLDAAWRNGSYRDIRNLEILQAHRLFTIQGRDQPAEARDVLYRAFTSLYQGKAADAFCEYLEHNNRDFQFGGGTPEYYGKFCSIVQSSGTSKSRLLLEIRTNGVLVLYLNLRPSIDIFSFLPRDVIPAEILTEARWAAADYSAQCCAFFAAVFTMVTEFLSTRLSSGSLEGALKQWNDSMCELRSEGRKQFFAGLNTKCDMYLEVFWLDGCIGDL